MTAMIDLDAELTAGAETPQGDASGLLRSGPRLTLPDSGSKVPPKAAGLIRRGVKLLDENKPEQGARILLKALDAAPELAVANQAMALALEKLGRLSRALEFYERALARDPKNAQLYQNIGHIAVKLGMLPAAEKFMRIQLQLKPGDAVATANLASVLRDQAKFEDAIELLRQAIYAQPENADLWNALGTAVMESGDAAQAATFYREVLRLRPDYSRGHHNLAHVLELTGDIAAALPHYETARADPASEKDGVISAHAHAHALLAAGRLAEGWAEYPVRLNPLYDQATNFLIPGAPWGGEDPADLRGKTILLIGEQGIGDEILFASMIGEAIEAVGPDGEVRIACEKRLIPLFQRSFPSATVARHYTIEREGRQHRHAPDLWKVDEIDLWAPFGALPRAFRPELAAFPEEGCFMTPDPGRIAHWRAHLGSTGAGPKIGILWKSLKMNARRSKHFSPFEQWKPILKTPGVRFVNLQYGETDAELADAKSRFGVEILQPEGIDLKNDLDDVAALGAACDLVIGPMNATTNLAAAAGGTVWFIHARSTSWTLLGQDRLAWYPQARSFFADGFGDWRATMARLAAALSETAAEAA